MPDRPAAAIRQVTIEDAALVAYHRVAMFREMGRIPTEALAEQLLQSSITALDAALRANTYVGWFALDTLGTVISGAGAHVQPQLPRITDDGKTVGTTDVPLVVNVYTEPAFRRSGLARALMLVLMEWARSQGFDRVLLHASDEGRPLYASLGFIATNEMRWTVRR